jgi:hypothetical protein
VVYFLGFILAVLSFCFLSCSRNNEPAQVSSLVTWSGAYPTAILQTGSNPLWFQLTEDGPVHIAAAEDAADIYAFTPWPYAYHIRFVTETAEGLVMIVNRDGFLKISAGKANELSIYRFSGGDIWKNYTAGGFINYEDNMTALLYLDERFLISSAPLPVKRTWSFNMNSNMPFPLDIPAFLNFPAEEGWNIDTVRLAADDLFYYRAARRSGASPVVRMFRTMDLSNIGYEISIEAFYSSAPKEAVFSHSSLPKLPEGFAYTGIGRVGNSIFASWEEQEDFSIGAAGFVVVKR